MATRITEFETHTGDRGEVYFTFYKRYCSDCGNEIKSTFSCKCERCGEVFDGQQINYISERSADDRVEI